MITINIESFIIGLISAYAVSCVFKVWKHQTLPNIKDGLSRMKKHKDVEADKPKDDSIKMCFQPNTEQIKD